MSDGIPPLPQLPIIYYPTISDTTNDATDNSVPLIDTIDSHIVVKQLDEVHNDAVDTDTTSLNQTVASNNTINEPFLNSINDFDTIAEQMQSIVQTKTRTSTSWTSHEYAVLHYIHNKHPTQSHTAISVWAHNQLLHLQYHPNTDSVRTANACYKVLRRDLVSKDMTTVYKDNTAKTVHSRGTTSLKQTSKRRNKSTDNSNTIAYKNVKSRHTTDDSSSVQSSDDSDNDIELTVHHTYAPYRDDIEYIQYINISDSQIDPPIKYIDIAVVYSTMCNGVELPFSFVQRARFCVRQLRAFKVHRTVEQIKQIYQNYIVNDKRLMHNAPVYDTDGSMPSLKHTSNGTPNIENNHNSGSRDTWSDAELNILIKHVKQYSNTKSIRSCFTAPAEELSANGHSRNIQACSAAYYREIVPNNLIHRATVTPKRTASNLHHTTQSTLRRVRAANSDRKSATSNVPTAPVSDTFTPDDVIKLSKLIDQFAEKPTVEQTSALCKQILKKSFTTQQIEDILELI